MNRGLAGDWGSSRGKESYSPAVSVSYFTLQFYSIDAFLQSGISNIKDRMCNPDILHLCTMGIVGVIQIHCSIKNKFPLKAIQLSPHHIRTFSGLPLPF